MVPVLIQEYVKIRDVEGKEHEGLALATNLVAVELEDKTLVYGMVTAMSKVRTKVICDAGDDCLNSTVDGEFKTVPKTIEFDDNGSNSAEFIKEISDIVITSDYAGTKQAYCSKKCAAHLLKKVKTNVVEFPSGKGKKTVFEPEAKETAELLAEESPAYIGGGPVSEWES